MTAAQATTDMAEAITPQSLRDWLATAEPGARFVYFIGFNLPQLNPVVREATALKDAGRIITAQELLPDRRRNYLAIKRLNAEGSPVSRAAMGAVTGRGGERGQASEESDCLMAILRRLASRGEFCPTNARLAEMALLKDAESVRYRLGLLQQCGRINVRTNAAGVRIVTIVASGRSTAS